MTFDQDLRITAMSREGEVMAIRHGQYPVYGIQFHPESVLTDYGLDLIRNFVTLALDWNESARKAA